MKKQFGSRQFGHRQHNHFDKHAHQGLADETTLLNKVKGIKSPFLLALDGIQDPHNLGACIRSAECAGVDAVILPRHKSVKITEVVQRVSCGAVEKLLLCEVVNFANFFSKLKRVGIWIVGLDENTDREIFGIDLDLPICLVMGAEGKGLRRLTKEKMDFLARIPMQGSTECLNVSVATGISLFEVVRQKNEK